MDVYSEALNWADQRGDSGGATRMRKLLLSLYNPTFYAYSAGEALAGMDAQGGRLAFACLRDYASLGETATLRRVGDQIRLSGVLDSWIELCKVKHEASEDLRLRWRLDSNHSTTDCNQDY